MTEKTFAEQTAEFVNHSFKDGDPADGSPTAEEQAAAEANARPADSENGAAEEQSDAEDDAAAAAGAEEAGDAGEEKPAAEQPKPDDKVAKPDDKAKGKPTVAERIGDVTAKWRGAQREADTLKVRAERAEAELAALKSGKAPLTAPETGDKGGDTPPDPSQFDYGELDPKYIAALARHETAQALKAAKADEDKDRQAAAAAAKQQETATKADALATAGLALHDDFEEVVMQGAREGKWDLSPTLGELLLDSEFGPQIAYDLATNPDESRRVAKLSPGQQAAYFGRQEAKHEAAKPSQTGKAPAKTPQAPPPPKTPKGGSGSNKVGADSQDFAAVEAAWRSGALR